LRGAQTGQVSSDEGHRPGDGRPGHAPVPGTVIWSRRP